MQPSELFFAFDFYSIHTSWPAFQFESYQISVRYFVLQSAYMEKILLCIFQVLDKAISFGSVEELYSSYSVITGSSVLRGVDTSIVVISIS